MAYGRSIGQSTSAIPYPSYNHLQLPTPAPTPDLNTVTTSSLRFPSGKYPQVNQGQAQPNKTQPDHAPRGATGTASTAAHAAGPSTQAFDLTFPHKSNISLPPTFENPPAFVPAVPGLPFLHPSFLSPRSANDLEANVEPGVAPLDKGKKPARRQRAPCSRKPRSQRTNVNVKKPYTRPIKPIASTSNAQVNPPFLLDDLPHEQSTNSIAGQSREAPPSPQIEVAVINTPANGKERTKSSLRTHVFQGLGPNEDQRIVPRAPAQEAPIKGTLHLVVGTYDDEWRCRWDGCRLYSPATFTHLRAHMQKEHGIHRSLAESTLPPEILCRDEKNGKLKVRCQWRCPLRVMLPGHSEPILITSHRLSYACDSLLDISSIENHIGTHLRNEEQPNMHAVKCCPDKPPFMSRGGHKCANKKDVMAAQKRKDEERMKPI